MEPGNLIQLVKETFVTPATVAMDALENLEGQEIEQLKQLQVEQQLPEGKMLALPNQQDQLQDQIKETKLNPLPDQQITEGTREQKERTKAPGEETKVKALENAQPLKLVVLKGQKGHNLGQPQGLQPLDNRLHLSVSNKNSKGQPRMLW